MGLIVRRVPAVRCRIEPLLDQGGACGAAGPASAPGSALGRPARRTPGHTRRTRRSKRLANTQAGGRRAVLSAPDCPARGHRVKGAYGVAGAIGYRRPPNHRWRDLARINSCSPRIALQLLVCEDRRETGAACGRPSARVLRGITMDFVAFRSFNFGDHLIRHRNFLGELTTFDSQLRDDFAFVLVRRGQQGEVALRSKNFPDRFLRHRDFRIRLEGPNDPNPQLFTQDTTFVMVEGLADSNGISFRSINFPSRFLRHRDFHLFLEEGDSPNLAPDATFFRQGVPGPIDDA